MVKSHLSQKLGFRLSWYCTYSIVFTEGMSWAVMGMSWGCLRGLAEIVPVVFRERMSLVYHGQRQVVKGLGLSLKGACRGFP